MSSPVYRATLVLRPHNAPNNPKTWTCEHEHVHPRAASKCGQLELRRRLPTSRDPVDHFRFAEMTVSYEIKSADTSGEWMSFTFYRQYAMA